MTERLRKKHGQRMLMDFAPLETLAQRLVWMAILGAGLVVVGLVFGLALGMWSAASVGHVLSSGV
jgi:ABC-type dipeptide/oligopeptide/nickel transport system permease component